MSKQRMTAFASLLVVATLTVASAARAEEVTFSDGADDAYGSPGGVTSPPATQPPNSVLSDPKADILEAGFANVIGSRGGPNHGSYSVTMTIAGTPDPTYSYQVAGEFGPDCQLYHSLKPGTTSTASAKCGSGETRREIGTISGSEVVVQGSTLTATYTYMTKRLPSELSADRELGPLFAYTCVSGLEGTGCRPGERLDLAEDLFETFTI